MTGYVEGLALCWLRRGDVPGAGGHLCGQGRDKQVLAPRLLLLCQVGPVVIKKDDEPLLNLTGAMSRCSRAKVLMCTQQREQESRL
jgi:hypothetical protein